jgi:ribosomal-protein-alanine N-acetyltransferase
MTLPVGVVYRPLGSTDIPALESMLLPLLSGNWSPAALLALGNSTHHCRVLCSIDESEAALLGFAEFTVVTDEGELLNLAIDAEAQGCGLGRALLDSVLDELRHRSCTRCFLEVRRSNDAAIALYTSSGFTLAGVRKGYYPPPHAAAKAEDALLYSRSL